MLKRFELFVITINQIYRSIQKLKSREMMELGLKGTDVMCLFHLGQHEEGLTAAELCTMCMEDKAAISRAVSFLSKKQLIVSADSENKRKYRARLTLTEEGKIIAHKMDTIISDAVSKGGDGLSEEEREIFYRALGTISQNLQRLCQSEKSSDEGDIN